jgi:hypothetical protein
MPSTSKKQHNFMEAIAHSPSFAKKVGVPQSVGKDFSTADKNRKFSKGGDTMASKMNPGFMAMMAKKKDGAKPAMKKGGMTKMADGGSVMSAKMGAVKTAAPSKDGIASKGKTKGTMVVMKGDKGMKRGGKVC